MKYLLVTTMFLSLSSWAAAPSSNLEASAAEASTPNEQQMMMENPTVRYEQMNTSPNPAPKSDEDVIQNSTLSNKPIEKNSKNIPGKREIQAQEDPMDYSTTPKKRARHERNNGVDQDNIGN